MSTRYKDEPSLLSSKKTLGFLHLFSETDQILDQSIFPLKSGDNFIGSGRHCQIILPYSSIDTMLCKISLNPDNEFTIEDLDSKIGIYRPHHDQLRQKLKPNKVYDLYPEKPFYIGDQYRCVFRPAPTKKHEENSGAASPLQLNDYIKPQNHGQYRRSTPSRSPSPQSQTEIPQTLPIASLEQEMDELERAYQYQASPAQNKKDKSQFLAPTKPSDFVNSLFHDDYDNHSWEERIETPAKIEQKPSEGSYMKNFKGRNMGLKTETRESEPEFEQREKVEESSLRAGNEAGAGLLAQLGNRKVEEDEDRADTVTISDDEEREEPEIEPEKPAEKPIEEEKSPEETPKIPKTPQIPQREVDENSNDDSSIFVKHFKKKGKVVPTPADELPGRRKEEKVVEIPSSFTGLEEDEATSFALTTTKKPEKVSKKKEKTPKKMLVEEEDEDEEEDPLKLIRKAKPVEAKRAMEDVEIEEENKGKKRGRSAKKEGKTTEERLKKAFEEEDPKKVIEEEKPKRGQRKPAEEKVTPIKEKKSPISKAKEQEGPKEPKGRNKKAEDVTPRRGQRGKADEEIDEEENTGRGMRSKRSTEKAREQEERPAKTGRSVKQVASPDTKTPRKVTPTKEIKRSSSRTEKMIGSPDTKAPRKVTPIKDEVKRGSRNEQKGGSPDTKTQIKPAAAVGRGKKKEENKQEEEVKKGRVSQRLAKKSAEKDEEEEKPKGKKGARGKSKVQQEEEEPVTKRIARGRSHIEDDEEVEEKPKGTAKKGSRGKSKVQQEEEEPATKRIARGKSRVEEEEDEEEKPVSKKEPENKRGRGRRQAQAQEEEEEKPVSKKETASKRGRGKSQEEEVPRRKKEAAPKKEKETKGKTAQKEEKKRGKKAAKVIEMEVEEEEEEEPEPEEVPKRGRKSKKTPERKEPEPKKNTRGKRSPAVDEEEPLEKKRKTSKSAAASKKNTPSEEDSLTKRNAFKVLFSGFAVNDKKVANAKKNLKTIGVNISEDMDNFNVLVMSELRRTIKFLFAVSQGASVVSFDWVTDSLKEGKAVQPDEYLFEDESIENMHHFKLNSLLKKVRKGERDLLKGYHVWMPSNIKPSFEEVKTLIEGIQGTVTKTKPGKYKEEVIILVNEGDEKQAKHFVDVGFKVHTTELIYSGILQQKLNFSQNQVKGKGK